MPAHRRRESSGQSAPVSPLRSGRSGQADPDSVLVSDAWDPHL